MTVNPFPYQQWSLALNEQPVVGSAASEKTAVLVASDKMPLRGVGPSHVGNTPKLFDSKHHCFLRV